jgi:hypothetical protein
MPGTQLPYDPAGPARQQFPATLMSSLDPRGATGPMLEMLDLAVERHGVETITVPAGTFACEHYTFDIGEGTPVEHLWVVPGDWQMVRIRWDLLGSTYELVELDERPSG